MKLSNKVLLGFLGFIFLYLTAAFTELRVAGTHNVIDNKNSIAETVDIAGVSHIVISDVGQYVRIVGDDQARLELRSIAGDMLKNLTYKISGDTLTLSAFRSDGSARVSLTVFAPGNMIEGVTVNRSAVSIDEFRQDFLRLSQNSSHISMSHDNIAKVQIDLSKESLLSLSDSEVDTLSAEIDASQVHISSPVGVVHGSMQNHAFMQLNMIREIQLKKDANSKLSIYQ